MSGTTWTALVVDWNLLTYSVARSALAGSSTALFRVTASDGFLTARDQSDAVCTIPNRGPAIYVRTPSQNQLFTGLQQIAFERRRSTGLDAGTHDLPLSLRGGHEFVCDQYIPNRSRGDAVLHPHIRDQ